MFSITLDEGGFLKRVDFQSVFELTDKFHTFSLLNSNSIVSQENVFYGSENWTINL
jgi:hypothetical protein